MSITPPNPFTPANWYWIVGGAASPYSSSAGDYVPVADASYQAWLAKGNTPTKIDTEANLGDVLAPYSLRPVAANVLDGYTSSQANNLTLQVVAKVLFNHENRIRVLEGKTAISAAQFVSAIKSLL